MAEKGEGGNRWRPVGQRGPHLRRQRDELQERNQNDGEAEQKGAAPLPRLGQIPHPPQRSEQHRNGEELQRRVRQETAARPAPEEQARDHQRGARIKDQDPRPT